MKKLILTAVLALIGLTNSALAAQQGWKENGQLHVCGMALCNESGNPIQLKGMSSHGLQWYGGDQSLSSNPVCLTPASLDTLAHQWNANVFRIAMYVQEGGYEKNPGQFTKQVQTLVEEATQRDMYVIVDWHILNPGNPKDNLMRAKAFFEEIARTNKDKTNVLYEIANEPHGVSWQDIKDYANELIPVIRNIAPNSVILVGTREWSSLGMASGADAWREIQSQPLDIPNIMYSFHFYASQHGHYLDELKKEAVVNKLPIFVTEFGMQNANGDGAINEAKTGEYLDFFAKQKISWVNWNYSDNGQSSAVWKEDTCRQNSWGDEKLKASGKYIKSRILN